MLEFYRNKDIFFLRAEFGFIGNGSHLQMPFLADMKMEKLKNLFFMSVAQSFLTTPALMFQIVIQRQERGVLGCSKQL